MNKFRKWFFKFFFGCELVEYMEILADWSKGIKRSQEILELCTKVNDESRSTINLAKAVNERCKMLLEKEKANEDLGR